MKKGKSKRVIQSNIRGEIMTGKLIRQAISYDGKWEDKMRSDLIEISAEIRGETDKAYRLFDGYKTEWVPKGFVENNEDGTFSMPEWLAKEKGFI